MDREKLLHLYNYNVLYLQLIENIIDWEYHVSEEKKKLTIPDLRAKKTAGERLVMVAVGEVLSASWAEQAGIDIIGIGDSLGMTLYGHENTLAITLPRILPYRTQSA